MKTINDPLPELAQWIDIMGIRIHAGLPESRRQLEEEKNKKAKKAGDDWVPYKGKEGLEINGKGQLRTKEYKPPEPPETDVVVFAEPFTTQDLHKVLHGVGWIPHKPGDPIPDGKGRVRFACGNESHVASFAQWAWSGDVPIEERRGMEITAWEPA